MEALKYPIGKLDLPSSIHLPDVKNWIKDIENFPDLLRYEVESLTLDQLEWKYRPEGWCIRQVVHHCADSHINSQMRFKLTLTEDKPTIKPYAEALWAQLPDMTAPIQWSLDLLDVLHKRWVVLLESLTEEDLKKEYVHPEHGRVFNLCQTVALYSWHCRHHLAHVKQAKAAKGSY
ncbi:MAG: YfiT family bacillithiol transferase [Cyclobacteriaceae bacterium]